MATKKEKVIDVTPLENEGKVTPKVEKAPATENTIRAEESKKTTKNSEPAKEEKKMLHYPFCMGLCSWVPDCLFWALFFWSESCSVSTSVRSCGHSFL